MKNDWVSVFEGDVWRVKVRQTELDGHGIATFVPDYVPSQDPRLAGTPTSVIGLFVHSADVERARAILAEKS